MILPFKHLCEIETFFLKILNMHVVNHDQDGLVLHYKSLEYTCSALSDKSIYFIYHTFPLYHIFLYISYISSLPHIPFTFTIMFLLTNFYILFTFFFKILFILCKNLLNFLIIPLPSFVTCLPSFTVQYSVILYNLCYLLYYSIYLFITL